ncbi:MAG: lamin tail domain-containing protein, partial [Candidatus Thermoplasmatota archaeon]|nr:lamin tail domain-containing protein [Candidatus Thermoplasmatota archaeon]
IEEIDEENNLWVTGFEVYPSIIPRGQTGLKITKVLWNCTGEEVFVQIENPTGEAVDLSGVRVSDGTYHVNFPGGVFLQHGSAAAVVWGPAASGRLDADARIFNISGGPTMERMVSSGPIPDPFGTGKVFLRTEFRTDIDQVLLRGKESNVHGWIGGAALETTWGTVLSRARSSDNTPLDSNTSMDWTVYPGRAAVECFLPSPGTSGPGEYLVISGEDRNVDISGMLIMCSRRAAVIPNGTLVGEGETIVLSKDPESYERTYGNLPDLCFGEGSVLNGQRIEGCRVPMFPELLLPNAGGELMIVDRANRILDSVAWGISIDNSIGTPSKDVVIGRDIWANGTKGGWRALGLGSDPIFRWSRERKDASTALFQGSLENGLEWLIGENDIILITPVLDNGGVISILSDHLSRGRGLKIFLTCEPWSLLGEADEMLHPVSTRAGYAKYLLGKGAKIHTSDIGQVAGSSLFVSGDRILTVLGPLETAVTDRDASGLYCFGVELGANWADTIEVLYDRFLLLSSDDLAGLSLVQPIEPLDVTTGQGGSGTTLIPRSVDLSIGSLQDPVLSDEDDDKKVRIYHSEGPLDMGYLLGLARSGYHVELMLGLKCLEVLGRGSRMEVSNVSERIMASRHILSIGMLSEDLLMRAAGSLLASEELGLDMEIRIGDVGSGIHFQGSMMTTNSEVRMTLPWVCGGGSLRALVLTGDTQKEIMDHLSEEWERSKPFPWGLIEGVEPIAGECPSVRIGEVYYDTYITNDLDEYICLENIGTAPVDISGFMVSDDEGLCIHSDGTVVLGDLNLGPGERIFITRNGSDFTSQNGLLQHLSWGSKERTCVLTSRGIMKLANNNDTVMLRDSRGYVVDTVTWGSAFIPEGVWATHESGRWTGPPCPDLGWGKVLFRTREKDTNCRDDWLSLRPRYPGQSRFELFDIAEYQELTVGVCPDSSSEVLCQALEDAENQVLVNVYEITSEWITSRFIGLHQRGLKVRVLLEGNPVGGLSYSEEVCISRMVNAGIEVRKMITDTGRGIRDRYRYDHAKYIVIDGDSVLLSTDNFKDTSFPRPGSKSHTGTRGWIVNLRSMPLADDLTNVFTEDWDGPDIEVCEALLDVEGLLEVDQVNQEPLTVFRAWYEPVHSSIVGTSQVLVSPDHLYLEDNPLLDLIRRSESEIILELMDIELEFLAGSIGRMSIPTIHIDDLEHYGANAMNPYLEELIHAANRGVNVTLLLDGSDFNGDGVPDAQVKARQIDDVIDKCGASDNFHLMMHPSPHYGLEGDINMIHTKGMIVDRSWIWISSFNWGPTSGLENREAGVLIASHDAAEYLREVLFYDLGGSVGSELELRKVWSFGAFDGEMISHIEVGLEVFWMGEGDLTIELHSMRRSAGETRLIKTVVLNHGFEGILVLECQEVEGEKSDLFIIRAVKNGLAYDAAAFEISEPMERSKWSSKGFLGNHWVPILLIFLLSVSISMIKAVAHKRRSYIEE